MDRMTARELTVNFCDDFHDWIDGDDPVASYDRVADNSIDVTFESGARLNVKVTELPDGGATEARRKLAEEVEARIWPVITPGLREHGLDLGQLRVNLLDGIESVLR